MAKLPFIVKIIVIFLSFSNFGNATTRREVDDLHPTFALTRDGELPTDLQDSTTLPSISSTSGVERVGEKDEIIPTPVAIISQTEITNFIEDDSFHGSNSSNIENNETIPNLVETQLKQEVVETHKSEKDDIISSSELGTKIESTSEDTVITNVNETTVEYITEATNENKEPGEVSFASIFSSSSDADNTLRNVVTDGIKVFSEKAYEGKICATIVTSESGEIVMPEAPLDPSCKAWSWTVTVGDGYYADLTVTSLDVNYKVNEYMIIGPGSSMADLWDDESNPILTAKITSPKKFRILEAETFSVLLVTNSPSGFKGGFKLSYERAGKVSTTTEPTTPASTLPTPAENITAEIQVYVQGFTPEQFGVERRKFQLVVAELANVYCGENNIELVQESTADNVVLTLIRQCDITWPNSDTCVQVNMSVAVITPNSANPADFELTAAHLQDMWDKYARNSEGLADLGLNVYDMPDPQSSLYLWLAVSLGVLVIFIVVLIAVWRIDVFKDYSRMDGKRDSISYSQRSSTISNNSWFTTQHQVVPPMHYDTGYQEYEPEFDGPAPGLRYREPSVTTTTTTMSFNAAPSYGPPEGFGGAHYFSGNNPSFLEDDEDRDMTIDDEVNTDTAKNPSSIMRRSTGINNTYC